MEKVDLTQRRHNEKAIIDALVKISEIVQKTEASRHRQKSTNRNKRSNKTVGDGDYNDLNDDNHQQQVPVPPPMRTLDSYVSGFNQQSLQKPSNCNQASTHRLRQYPSNPPWDSSEHNKQSDQSSGKQRLDNDDYQNQEHSSKRHFYDTSSTSSSSNDHQYRKKSSRHHSSHRSFRSNKNPQSIYQETEKPTITILHSQGTNVLDDQSSSLIMMPIASAPIIPSSPSINIEQQFSSSSDILTNPKTDFDTFIDQQLQTTLKEHLKHHLLTSTKTTNENLQQRKTRSSTLTKSETEKLINELDFTKQIFNSEHYEKQRELAMLAAQQGNYSLSYSIYTTLLHDNQYDYKLKSEILASRATILLFEQKCFESIDDCTQSIAFNQWNKLAYVIRAACWMIKQEYLKAVNDYSKLFHFFDQSQHVLDLLNLAYEKFQLLKSIKIEQENEIKIPQQPITSSIDNPTQSFSLPSPTTSFIQPAVYLYYPRWCSTSSYPSVCSEKPFQRSSSQSNNNAMK